MSKSFDINQKNKYLIELPIDYKFREICSNLRNGQVLSIILIITDGEEIGREDSLKSLSNSREITSNFDFIDNRISII